MPVRKLPEFYVRFQGPETKTTVVYEKFYYRLEERRIFSFVKIGTALVNTGANVWGQYCLSFTATRCRFVGSGLKMQ